CQVTGFDWGAAWTLPFTPALHYRRSILVPARWQLRAHWLPGRLVSLDHWASQVDAWRCRASVPDRVLLAMDDQHLPLDLTRPMHLDPLRAHLSGSPVAILHDAPPSDAGTMRRLLHAGAAQRDNAEPGWAARVAAFHGTGRRLARLNAGGQLTRGLRAILAHHAIFAFNRAGAPVQEQAAAAWLAQHIAFADHEPVSLPANADQPRETTTMTVTADPAELRHAMVDTLTRSGHLRTPAIIDAFRNTERHQFLPGVAADAAYAEDAVPIKHGDDSEMISCISAPSIVATQLEQLAVRAGDKVLEAGAATGYNAALLSQLVGPVGHVWTVDVDQDLVDGARRNVAATGAANVTVALGDGAVGLPGQGPFDRIQFTVGAWDIPVKILDQLAPGGRLVIPMRIRGSISRSF